MDIICFVVKYKAAIDEKRADIATSELNKIQNEIYKVTARNNRTRAQIEMYSVWPIRVN